MKTASPTLESIETLLRQVIAEQARHATIQADILRAIERSQGPRDAADQAVLVAIAEAIGDRRWTSGQLLEHAALVPALRDALLAADVTATSALGWFCRRVHGGPGPGTRLERVGDSRAGVLWRVVLA